MAGRRYEPMTRRQLVAYRDKVAALHQQLESLLSEWSRGVETVDMPLKQAVEKMDDLAAWGDKLRVKLNDAKRRMQA